MSEKITCDVIRDLMILCEEELCSEDSKRLIMDHIGECEECKKIYEMIKAPMPETKMTEENETERLEENAIKSFKKFKKKMTIETIVLIFAVMLTLLFGEYIWSEYVKEWVHAVPASQINVTELYQLKNGDIYCTLECNGSFSWKKIETMQVPDDMRLEDCDQAWHEIHFQTKFLGEKETEMMRDSITLIFPKEAVPYDDEIDRKCAAIKYIGRNKDDVLMIWEANLKLENASQEIEEIAMEYINESYGYSYGFPIIVKK